MCQPAYQAKGACGETQVSLSQSSLTKKLKKENFVIIYNTIVILFKLVKKENLYKSLIYFVLYNFILIKVKLKKEIVMLSSFFKKTCQFFITLVKSSRFRKTFNH